MVWEVDRLKNGIEEGVSRFVVDVLFGLRGVLEGIGAAVVWVEALEAVSVRLCTGRSGVREVTIERRSGDLDE